MANAQEEPANKYRILAIHAHPDDESSKGAATMARYVDEGHRVKVLTCTGGERGDILNPHFSISDALPAISGEELREVVDNGLSPEQMQQIRRKEMAEAASILGIEHEWLGYVDSGLPEGDPVPPLPQGCFALVDTELIVQAVVKVIRDFRPHVIITYDENGGYPHPDHLKVHEVSIKAWDEAADAAYHPELGQPWEVSKLYYTHGFVRRRFELLADAMLSATGTLTPQVRETMELWEHMTDIFPRVTTRVPVGQWFERRDDALRAHATQIDPRGPFFIVDPEIQRQVWPTEEFELALSRIHSELPEDDLFAGLSPSL